MQDRLQNAHLFREKAYVNGCWVDASDQQTVEVRNPANQEVLGTVPKLSNLDVAKAIDEADKAQIMWAKKTAKERAVILRKLYDLMIDHKDDLGTILTLEQGKPLAEAKGEILYAASFFEWFAEEGKRVYGDIIPTFANDKRVMVLKQPIGVVGSITPWNFPSAMITRKCAPALAAGCSIIIKPAAETPYSALALAVLAEKAGVPAGVLNVVTGDAKEIGGELTSNDLVRKISFTGSTEVGRLLMRQCSDSIKKLSLELGGHAPFIVFEDADIDSAIEGAILSKYRNSGQTCVCANRFYIHEDVYSEFTQKFSEAVKNLHVGSGMDTDVQQGPLISDDAVAKVDEHVQDAIQNGATLLTGGKPHILGGYFYEPTVLGDITPLMKISNEETFGPVAGLTKFKSEKEVIELANSSDYGLAAYFYGKEMAKIWRVAEALEYGIIGVNSGIISTEVAPFGGIKQSGIGREGSKYGIDDYLEIKYVLLGNIA